MIIEGDIRIFPLFRVQGKIRKNLLQHRQQGIKIFFRQRKVLEHPLQPPLCLLKKSGIASECLLRRIRNPGLRIQKYSLIMSIAVFPIQTIENAAKREALVKFLLPLSAFPSVHRRGHLLCQTAKISRIVLLQLRIPQHFSIV